jgi:hypothetical protein
MADRVLGMTIGSEPPRSAVSFGWQRSGSRRDDRQNGDDCIEYGQLAHGRANPIKLFRLRRKLHGCFWTISPLKVLSRLRAWATISSVPASAAEGYMLSQHMIVAWYATLMCVIFSAWIAAAFLRDEPILFTVMALFAFTWVLLLPYYGGARNEGRPELVEVYTGFLTVYVGGLLTFYAANAQGQKRPPAVVEWQYAGLGLLLIVAVPSAPGLLSPDGSGGFVKLSWHQADLLIGVGLGIVGFVPIVLAVRRFCDDVQASILATILFLYGLSGVAWAIYSWPESKGEMESSFAYLFATMKVTYTLTLGTILAYHAMTPRDKRQGPWHWILILFAVRHAERKK